MNFATVKSITIPEGNVVKIAKGDVVLWQAEPETEPIINLIDTVGYTDNKRLSVSSGTEKDQTNNFVTGYIPITDAGDIYRTSGASFDCDKNGNCCIQIYRSDYSYWTYSYTKPSVSPVSVAPWDLVIDADGNLTITINSGYNNDGSGTAYLRLCGIGSGTNLMVTKNQEIGI